MAFAFGVARPTRELQMPPRPRRRSPVASRINDAEKLERDFWQVFDLEKFATDWNRSSAKRRD